MTSDPSCRAVSAATAGPQRVSSARGAYAVQPLDDRIIAQQQEIADTFAALRVIPARIDVRAAVWRQSWQVAEAAQ